MRLFHDCWSVSGDLCLSFLLQTLNAPTMCCIGTNHYTKQALIGDQRVRNMLNMQIHMRNMQKICKKYAQYAKICQNMLNIPKFMHNLCAHYFITDISVGIIPEIKRSKYLRQSTAEQQSYLSSRFQDKFKLPANGSQFRQQVIKCGRTTAAISIQFKK